MRLLRSEILPHDWRQTRIVLSICIHGHESPAYRTAHERCTTAAISTYASCCMSSQNLPPAYPAPAKATPSTLLA